MIRLLVSLKFRFLFFESCLCLFYLEKEVKVNENDYYFPDQSTANRIPRANVARFMLDILKDEKYIRQGVAIDMSKASN